MENQAVLEERELKNRMSSDEAMVKAKATAAINLPELVFQAALGVAERSGVLSDMRTKCTPFFKQLVEGGNAGGLKGQWFAEVTHDVAGWDHWCMITNATYFSGIVGGTDGCRHIAAYFA